MTETIVISVGGSLIVPDDIDTAFLDSFKEIILEQIDNGKRFVIITGGGMVARRYQQAASEVTNLQEHDVDWLGIHATRINAHLMRTIFYKQAHPRIIHDPTEDIEFEEDILVAAGWKPGFSTDHDAVLIAKNLGADRVLNLTNIDYVYDKDPNEFEDAEPIEETDWSSFREILPDEWEPGLNTPFDPVASEEAQELGLEVAIINGNELEAVRNYLDGKDFTGTVIKD